jgi:ribonuclease T1
MLFLGSAGRRRAASALVAVAAVASLACNAREAAPATVSFAALPMEARTTLVRIQDGGPFPYPRDGVIFNNRERLLPTKPYGYYHEYTVPTPQTRTRGARRVVCGGAVATLSECYYSDDHYRSFRKIQP